MVADHIISTPPLFSGIYKYVYFNMRKSSKSLETSGTNVPIFLVIFSLCSSEGFCSKLYWYQKFKLHDLLFVGLMILEIFLKIYIWFWNCTWPKFWTDSFDLQKIWFSICSIKFYFMFNKVDNIIQKVVLTLLLFITFSFKNLF